MQVAATSMRGWSTFLLEMALDDARLRDRFAARLRLERARRGGGDARRFPQPQMAALLGVSLRTYQGWEAGLIESLHQQSHTFWPTHVPMMGLLASRMFHSRSSRNVYGTGADMTAVSLVTGGIPAVNQPGGGPWVFAGFYG